MHKTIVFIFYVITYIVKTDYKNYICFLKKKDTFFNP